MTGRRWTDKRVEILNLLSQGFTEKQIGNILKISFRTVQNHKKVIFKMLEDHSTHGAVGEAFRLGILKCESH